MVERAFSAKNAAYKSLISLLLLVPAVFALIILIKTEKAIGFDCTSCREDAYNGDVCTTSASPWSYNICVFKITCMITSFVLLLPFLFETVGMGLILADCLTEPHDTVPTIRFLDSNYLEYDLVNDKHNEMRGLFSSNLIRRSGYFFVATFLLLAAPIQHIIEEKSMSSIGRATKGYAGFLPDLVLTVILFPLSAYVILSSQTVAETVSTDNKNYRKVTESLL